MFSVKRACCINTCDDNNDDDDEGDSDGYGKDAAGMQDKDTVGR